MVFEGLRFGWSKNTEEWEKTYKRFISFFVDSRSERLVEELRPTRRTIREFEAAYLAPGAKVVAVLGLRTGQELRVTESLLQRHIYVQGSIGSGKTTFLKALLRGLLARHSELDKFVIFDPKGDYLKLVREAGYPYVVVSENPEFRPVRWNVFAEILGDSVPDFKVEGNAFLRAVKQSGGRPTFEDLVAKKELYMRLRKVAQGIVFTRANLENVKSSKSDPYFTQNAPASLTEGVLGCLILDAVSAEHGLGALTGVKGLADLNNRLLARVVAMSDNELRKFLQVYKAYEAGGHIGTDAAAQAMGVLSTWRMYMKDIFTLEFAEAGTWSIAKELRDPGFKVILLEYRLDNEKVAIPVFSAILSNMMDEVLSTRLKGRNLYVILDELHALPKIESFHTFLNMARDLGGKVIAATQSVAQLYDKYGEQEAKAIISAFNTRVFLRTTDDASLKLVNDTIGKLLVRRYSKSYSSGRGRESGGESVSHSVEQKEISALSLSTLPPGVGLIWTTGGKPILAPFAQ